MKLDSKRRNSPRNAEKTPEKTSAPGNARRNARRNQWKTIAILLFGCPSRRQSSSAFAVMSSSIELPTLTVERVQEALCRVCESANLNQNRWIFQSADELVLQAAVAPRQPTVDPSLLFGIQRTEASPSQLSASSTTSLCTFYLAYSTWEGRVLFLDYSKDRHNAADCKMWSRLLARIGKALHCRRLVWTHRGALPSYGSVTPETLDGWLTLHWKLPALQSFAPRQNDSISQPPSSAVASSLRQAFHGALDQPHERFRLRLASAADVDIIDRLVLGLALFEKEPESYKLQKAQLQQDGFGGCPLYYCILVDAIAQEGEEKTTPYTCAMAFCYVGYHLTEGRFLYLEDLFFEEQYRGLGGGSLGKSIKTPDTALSIHDLSPMSMP